MSEKVGSDMISRRSALRSSLSFLGLLAASSLVVLPSVLTASDAEAQTVRGAQLAGPGVTRGVGFAEATTEARRSNC
jgi:hypothetical protein